ncbi:MAG: histidine kinase dimerization/phospho-acceptor domain-containing protein, partial [Bacteroidales bacterium]|nr:histidine kinase dimerization/phospho-acceptor domain-containing protein [Bacteroidales bacterium]
MRFILYAAILLFGLPGLHTGGAQAGNSVKKEKTNLLIVHSFDSNLPDYKNLNKLVQENLEKKNVPAEISTFYLDCDTYDREDEIQRIYNYIDTLTFKPDIILVTDDQATYSLLVSAHPFLKTVPIVFSGVNFPNWDVLKEYPNVTGIWDNPDYLGNIRMIEELVGIKRIRFFYDRTYNGKRVIERLAKQYRDNGGNNDLYRSLVRFLQYGDSIENETVIENGYLKGNDDGERPASTSLYFINMRDDLGRDLLWNISGSFHYSVFLLTKYDYTIAQVGRLATVPTFSAVNKGFGCNLGILGGYFTTLAQQAEEACDYIAQIVKGKVISELPVKESSKEAVLDWTELNRWEIPVSQVPSGIRIVNMPFYVKYRTEAILLFAALTILIVSVITYLLFLYRREAKRKRQAQLNLWEEKEFLSLALEGGSIFAWKYDKNTDEFFFDKEFLDSVGVTHEAIKLKELIKMTHPDELGHSISSFINVVNRVEQRCDLRTRIDFNGKGYIWYEFRFLNVAGVLGEKSSVIGLIMNIQDYKNKEEELIRAKDLASKAELKQSFLANMSHEIRTPLNAIVGFSNLLVSSEELGEEEKTEFIGTINKNCELLLKLINDILEISRIESGNMSFTLEPCNLNELAVEIYDMCRLQAPSGVSFIKNTPETPVYIETDTMRLKQVIVNFVNNAFKFTSSG